MKMTIDEIVKSIYTIHRSKFENWKEGTPDIYWFDYVGIVLVIKYTSGNYWHYRYDFINGNIVLIEWW
jgi:hypothetical protein